jgi:hypothetical protein
MDRSIVAGIDNPMKAYGLDRIKAGVQVSIQTDGDVRDVTAYWVGQAGKRELLLHAVVDRTYAYVELDPVKHIVGYAAEVLPSDMKQRIAAATEFLRYGYLRIPLDRLELSAIGTIKLTDGYDGQLIVEGDQVVLEFNSDQLAELCTWFAWFANHGEYRVLSGGGAVELNIDGVAPDGNTAKLSILGISEERSYALEVPADQYISFESVESLVMGLLQTDSDNGEFDFEINSADLESDIAARKDNGGLMFDWGDSYDVRAFDHDGEPVSVEMSETILVGDVAFPSPFWITPGNSLALIEHGIDSESEILVLHIAAEDPASNAMEMAQFLVDSEYEPDGFDYYPEVRYGRYSFRYGSDVSVAIDVSGDVYVVKYELKERSDEAMSYSLD